MKLSIAKRRMKAQLDLCSTAAQLEYLRLTYIITVRAEFCYSMLLLTSCEVHTGKYLERSYEVRTNRSEVRTKS